MPQVFDKQITKEIKQNKLQLKASIDVVLFLAF